MDIWQSVTTVGSASWGSFAGIQIYANLDNSFTIASSGNLDGSGSTNQNVLAAQVSAFGTSAPNALQPFMANLPFVGNQPLTFDQFSAYDIERLSNGNWAVALVMDETTTVYPYDRNFVMMEFDQNLQMVNIQNYGTFNGVFADIEVTNLTSGFYNLTFDYGGFGNLPTQIHSATSQVGNLPNGSANNFYSSPNGGVVRDTEVFWDNTIGGAQQVWIEDSAGIHSIRTASIDANGNLTSGPSTLWTGLPNDTAFDLAVLKGSSRTYVLWNHNVANAAEGDLDLMIRGGPGGATTTISIPDLLGLTSSQYFIHQMTELANGNIAILYQPNAVSENHHLLILTSTGVLVEDYAIASFVPVYDYSDLTMTELSDGRIAIAARETTNITGPSDLVHLILDPRADTIFGTAGNDFILGKTNKAETIFAGEGNDTLHTMTGGGFLYGEGGEDQLFGDAGDDFFSGGNDNDLIFGRGGNDEIHGGAGADSIAGEDGSDVIFGDGGRDGISGGIGIDTIHGGDEGDTISGDDDADVLYGDAGADELIGGTGNDELYGGTDNDLLRGGDGIDFLFGEDGEDTLLGGIDNDHLTGGAGNDILNGEDGSDILRGGTGNDTINAGADIDLIYGDAGIDQIDGGADQDTVSFVESAAEVTVDMGSPGFNTGDAAGDTYANVEIFRLSNFGDTFFGGSNSSVFSVYGGGEDRSQTRFSIRACTWMVVMALIYLS